MKQRSEVYVERRPAGDYAVRQAGSKRASVVAPTQATAIATAQRLNPGAAVHVERVRTTSKGKPDKWRNP